MTNREKMLAVFRDALGWARSGESGSDALRYEAGVLMIEGESYRLGDCREVHLFGSGKASVETARAVKAVMGDRLTDGLVVSNYGAALDGITVFESSHPVLTEKSIRAAEILMRNMSALSADDFFIYVLSGGSSALIEKPIPPITLAEMQGLVKGLLANDVSHRGDERRPETPLPREGRGLGRLSKARGIVLVVSDVIGDDLEAIGSAPMFFDRSSFADTHALLKKYGLREAAPESVRMVIQKGSTGRWRRRRRGPTR